MLSFSGFDVGVFAHVEQRSHRVVRPEDHATAVSAVSAVGTSLRLVRLAMEGGSPVTTASGDDRYASLIDKLHGALLVF
jgi:hypothetical protein